MIQTSTDFEAEIVSFFFIFASFCNVYYIYILCSVLVIYSQDYVCHYFSHYIVNTVFKNMLHLFIIMILQVVRNPGD